MTMTSGIEDIANGDDVTQIYYIKADGDTFRHIIMYM
jgi:hypothetical protein